MLPPGPMWNSCLWWGVFLWRGGVLFFVCSVNVLFFWLIVLCCPPTRVLFVVCWWAGLMCFPLSGCVIRMACVFLLCSIIVTVSGFLFYFLRLLIDCELLMHEADAAMLQRQLCHPLTASSKNHSSDQLALICDTEVIISMITKMMCSFLPRRYALCITIKKKHALQIVVTQNMTLHGNLYEIEFSEFPIT